MSSLNPTKRFSNRVEHYLQYRPRYPQQVVTLLTEKLGLRPEHIIADIGSGTGFLTELFLEEGHHVLGVEPNREMREAGEEYLSRYRNFRSIDGTAEKSGLEARSVDMVLAGQAFHWFDAAAARGEFLRILREPGRVALIWNHRKIDATPFLVDYEHLLRTYATDYDKVVHRVVSSDEGLVGEFFSPGDFTLDIITDHEQVFDFEGLKGRLLSSSYAPAQGEPNHDEMIAELRRLFDKHQEEGYVRFLYDTIIYHGFLKPASQAGAGNIFR